MSAISKLLCAAPHHAETAHVCGSDETVWLEGPSPRARGAACASETTRNVTFDVEVLRWRLPRTATGGSPKTSKTLIASSTAMLHLAATRLLTRRIRNAMIANGTFSDGLAMTH